MGKPKPLEFSLLYWKIEYGKDRFDVGVIGPDPADWKATIVWTIKGQKEVMDKNESGCFKTFEETREWIELNTGLNYAGFSDRPAHPKERKRKKEILNDVASLELCQELFKLSGWDELSDWYSNHKGHYTRKGFVDAVAPAYPLGYLLRKLPPTVSITHASENTESTRWVARTTNVKVLGRKTADIPEDAAAKLCIELIKQGVIKP